MTVVTAQWKLDTCECIIEYSYDNNLPNGQMVYDIQNIVHKCTDHQSLNTRKELWDVIKEENPRWNMAMKILLNNAPTSLYNLQSDGITRRFKPGIKLDRQWSGTVPNRVLTITLTGATLTANQKNIAQNFLNNRFPGKVILVNN